MGLYQLFNATHLSGPERTIAGLGSLVGFFTFGGFFVGVVLENLLLPAFTFGGFFVGVVLENLLLPALPAISAQLPYYQWAFVLLGFAAFFLLYWSVLIGLPDLFTRWKRLLFMPIIHVGTFILFTLFFTNPSNVTQVSSGVESYIRMPPNVSFLALLWVLVYLGIAPLYAFYRYGSSEDIRRAGAVRWVRVLWCGFLFQLIGYLLDVIQFHDPFISIVRGIIALGWFMILIGYIQTERTKRSRLD
jgi:hypothetical protein